MKYSFELPEYVEEILRILHNKGYEAYIVGGSVRDLVIGNTPDDFDITTSALPEQTSALFSKNYRVIETGIKHGTVTVMSHGNQIEITTYRKDGKYSDCRRPESVTFTPSLEEDLKRRDFTVNALAYDGKDRVVDCFGGLVDIGNKIIRCIGNPDERFSEDALRILRMLRFSAKLNFDIDENTAVSAINLRHLLKHISSERIFVEINKLFSSDYPERISDVLGSYKCVVEAALGCAFDEEKYISAVNKAVLMPNINYLRFRYFLFECAENLNQLRMMLNGLKVSNSFYDDTVKLCTTVDSAVKISDIRTAMHFAKHFGYETLCEFALIFKATQCDNRLEEFADKIKVNKLCYSLKQLEVNGRDILETVSINDNRMVGEILSHLLDCVIDEDVKNERKELLSAARKYAETHRIK